jgi:hypothetical protein
VREFSAARLNSECSTSCGVMVRGVSIQASNASSNALLNHPIVRIKSRKLSFNLDVNLVSTLACVLDLDYPILNCVAFDILYMHTQDLCKLWGRE